MKRTKSFLVISLLFISFISLNHECFSENLLEKVLLKAHPEELRNITCPFHITLIAQFKAGDNMYKTESVYLKYRLVGDDGNTSDWRYNNLPKGQTKSDIFRRRIDPAAIMKNNDIKKNPHLTIVGDTVFYNGWSVLEVVYQDMQRAIYKNYSNKANFKIECELAPPNT